MHHHGGQVLQIVPKPVQKTIRETIVAALWLPVTKAVGREEIVSLF